MKRLIFSTGLCLLSLHSLATEPRWYEVSLLIFSNNIASEQNPETWPTYPLLDIPENAIQIVDPADDNSDQKPSTDNGLPAPFEALPENLQYLKSQANRLAASKNYTVLYHNSWFHPVLPEKEASPVEIIGGHQYGSINELHGLIKIHISRYLHVETNLYLTDVALSNSPFDLLTGTDSNSSLPAGSLQDQLEPFGGLALFSSPDNKVSPVNGQKNQYYVATSSAHMDMKRRMRSKELYYFDNPKFGMLIYFVPMEDIPQATAITP
ncbi:CsiV family protein [Gynuella sunshinyii]|uniref:Peptidoglycan-binding protein CsiV n=1 Tax=Gynuella sunshinyii YC6258 TaxID=1445510 RepID=A0A0C5VY53_9GAMM|nr:CsiV family protein [Gynuella sunshinyii]AJQ95299.1 hypothetical Protein YC6258_03263 [Gynuella sunshinyii YC6258]